MGAVHPRGFEHLRAGMPKPFEAQGTRSLGALGGGESLHGYDDESHKKKGKYGAAGHQ